IVSMSRLGENKAIEAMATNLGEYYRYTTRSENPESSLKDELGLVLNYLSIQKLRRKIEYEVDVPDSLLSETVPRLTLQPLVENAIVHGTEPSDRAGKIIITGRRTGDIISLIVEDNGNGMLEQ